MSYVHLTADCFAEAVGPHGLDRARYEQLLAGTSEALENLRARGPHRCCACLPRATTSPR